MVPSFSLSLVDITHELYGLIDPLATFKYYAKLMRKNSQLLMGTGGFSLEEHQRFRFEIEKCQVPKAVLENDSLTFSGPARAVVLPNTLLEEFVELSESDSNAICTFANKWGRLGLCGHNLPATHSLPLIVRGIADSRCKERASEKIQEWKQWSRKFKIVWHGAMSLHSGAHADPQDWEIVLADANWSREVWESLMTADWDAANYWASDNFSLEWALLADLVNYYIDVSGLRFRFSFDLSKILTTIIPRVILGCPHDGGLFGVLAMQLMFAASNSEGGAICTSCGLPFFPKRRPKAGQRRFCPTCGRKAANRYAARDFRQSHPNYRQQFD